MKKDWCTLWPDKFLDIDYSECCYQHDIDYFLITKLPLEEIPKARLLADLKLMRGVREKGLPKWALLMMFGIRMFGWLFLYEHVKKNVDLDKVDFRTIQD